MIIDAHTHVFPSEIQRDRRPWLERDPAFAAIYASARARIATVDDLLRSMDAAGVAQSVACCFGWSDLDLCRRANDALMEAVAAHPDRIIGFGMAPPAAGEAARAELRRCAAGGLRGIGELRPDDQGVDAMDGEELDAYLTTVRDLGLALLTHVSEPVGHPYPGKGRATPDRVLAMLERCPGLTTVLAHWGGGLPFYALMPEVREALATAYVDTAASQYLYAPRVFRAVADCFGAERILFASDFPLVTQERMVRLLDDADLNEDERAAVMGGNARRLLGA